MCKKKSAGRSPVDTEEQSQSSSVPPTLLQIDFLMVNCFKFRKCKHTFRKKEKAIDMKLQNEVSEHRTMV